MISRSAHAAIKGYFYQFDHTIIQVLSAANNDAEIIVEGIEDIDAKDGDKTSLIQCKYYEGTEYNHSVVKGAVTLMVRHFHGDGCKKSSPYRYKIYGHYSAGQDKLPATIDVNFLKKNFLTSKSKSVTTEVHTELGMTDAQLCVFLVKFEMDIFGLSYEAQQADVEKLLIAKVAECKRDDVKTFFYPLAIQVIQGIAIKKRESDRTLTLRQFLQQVDQKEVTFNFWLKCKFGDDYYYKLIRRKYFNHIGTRIEKRSRIFVIDLRDEFDLVKITALLSGIARRYSHVEHKRTPPNDRFCPYVHLRGLTRDELVQIKGNMLKAGINISDGYLYDGAQFSPESLALPPTRDNLIQLKFIGLDQEIALVIPRMIGTQVEIFDFFKEASISLPTAALHHKIKVESAFTVGEVI
jgi:hypothetical protein